MMHDEHDVGSGGSVRRSAPHEAWWRPLAWGGGVAAAGGLLVALTRWTGLCGEQAQGLILALTAGVGAAYAYLTWRMADAARKSAEAAWRHAELQFSAELEAWLPWYGKGDDQRCICQVRNWGNGHATEVRVQAMWADEDARKTEIVLYPGLIPREEAEQRPNSWPAACTGKALRVVSGQCREMVVPRPPADRKVKLKLEWVDPVSEERVVRRWCLVPRGDRHDRIEADVSNPQCIEDNCAERGGEKRPGLSG